MTDNHLLLNRLAELMLEHEQHVLPVDLLFDDERIGDFVKSIQIDSPYQQMVFDGVLTESVRDEKLYVSFTVEGYFHFVLGEVIYNRTEGLEAVALKQIIEENKLNGAKEGVEQCLIRDMQKGDLSRLTYLIDSNEVYLGLCVYPILVGIKSRYETVKSKTKKTNSEISHLFSVLLKQPTEMDYKVIYEVIKLANRLNLFGLTNITTLCLLKIIKLKSTSEALLISKVLEFVQDNKLRLKMAVALKEWQRKFKPQGVVELEVYSGIAKTFEELNVIKEAEFYYRKCLKFELREFGEYHIFSSTSYNQLGLLKLKNRQFHSGLNFFKRSFKIKIKILDETSNEITNALHNIALTYQYLANYKKCIQQYELVLERRLKSDGKISLETSLTLCNLGLAYAQSKISIQRAEELLSESFKTNIKILGNPNVKNTQVLRSLAFVEWQKEERNLEKVKKILHKALIDNIKLVGKNDLSTAYCLDDLFQFYYTIRQVSKAVKYGERAVIIYEKILGKNHPHTLNMQRRLQHN